MLGFSGVTGTGGMSAVSSGTVGKWRWGDWGTDPILGEMGVEGTSGFGWGSGDGPTCLAILDTKLVAVAAVLGVGG